MVLYWEGFRLCGVEYDFKKYEVGMSIVCVEIDIMLVFK